MKNMWQYLSPPYDSIAVWKLVEGAWGQQTLEQVVELHERSKTFAVLSDMEFIALANLTPVHHIQSAWLMVWLAPEHRRKLATRAIWQQLYELCFDIIGFKTLIAVTQSKGVQRLATRFGGRSGDTIRNLYGPNKHGYIAVWET